MQIAFNSLIVILTITPGIVLRYTYRRGFWNYPIYLSELSHEIIYGIVLSLLVNVSFYFFLQKTIWDYDFKTILLIFTGVLDGNSVVEVSQNIKQNFIRIMLYFVSMNIFALLIGFLLHGFVRGLALDLKFRFFRFNNDWYYLLYGEKTLIDELKVLGRWKRLFVNCFRIKQIAKSTYAFISAIVIVGNKQFIYWGIVNEFKYNKSGDVEFIVLQKPHRRILDHDTNIDETFTECDPTIDKRFYKIKGEYLILNYKDVITLNLDYRYIVKKEQILTHSEN